jgi:hypothetical protein
MRRMIMPLRYVSSLAAPYALTRRHIDAPMLVKGFVGHFLSLISGLNWNGDQAGDCWVADKTGWGRSGWRAGSYEVTPSRSGGAGDGRRIVSRPAGMRQPISGSGRPRGSGGISQPRSWG